jgi:hypothetical protein
MLYNIHINQLAFSQFEKLDYRHCIIFDAIHKIFTTFIKIEKLYENDQEWYWLSYDLLLDQIPLLKIGKDQLRNLLKDLALYKLISINPNNQKYAKTYFCFGENAEIIFRPLEKIQDPSGKNSRPPLEKIQDYNYKNIINKNNKREKIEKTFCKIFDIDPVILPQPYELIKLLEFLYKKEIDFEKYFKFILSRPNHREWILSISAHEKWLNAYVLQATNKTKEPEGRYYPTIEEIRESQKIEKVELTKEELKTVKKEKDEIVKRIKEKIRQSTIGKYTT